MADGTDRRFRHTNCNTNPGRHKFPSTGPSKIPFRSNGRFRHVSSQDNPVAQLKSTQRALVTGSLFAGHNRTLASKPVDVCVAAYCPAYTIAACRRCPSRRSKGTAVSTLVAAQAPVLLSSPLRSAGTVAASRCRSLRRVGFTRHGVALRALVGRGKEQCTVECARRFTRQGHSVAQPMLLGSHSSHSTKVEESKNHKNAERNNN